MKLILGFVLASVCASPQDNNTRQLTAFSDALLTAKQIAAGCVTYANPSREAEEDKELDLMRTEVANMANQICRTHRCTGNAQLWLCADKLWGGKCYSGCANWSIDTFDAIAMIHPLKYHHVRREQRCVTVPGTKLTTAFCHWVVVVTNLRTADEIVFDTWGKKSGWIFGGGALHKQQQSGEYPYSLFKQRMKDYNQTDQQTAGICPQ